ncbi:MAG: ABC transporter substrate-binding protein [Actinomycetia bacterium]|nr:ABC transporter substrate-binding protein [Actinomycetes bacterium]
MARRTSLPIILSSFVLFVSCSGDDTTIGTPQVSSNGSTDDSLVGDSVPANLDVHADEPFPAERCAANQAAGTILYLSGFDLHADASIIDVLNAESKGYYDELCLKVEVRASFSTDNYPLIAANDAQFASAGSFSEVVDFAGANDAGFVALAVEGRTGIDALITKDGEVASLEDVRGKKIGVKGAITPSVRAMLAQAGLVLDVDYETVLLDGFDPMVHIEAPGIVGFPGYKSNEPFQLEANNVPFKLYDPSDYDIPGSFGVIYTNVTFLQEHPTAAQDFMRATMRGLADAVADPDAAVQVAVDALNARGDAAFFTPEGEAARWQVQSDLLKGAVADGAPLGLPLVDELLNEVTVYAESGLFGGEVPIIDTLLDVSVLEGVYDNAGTLIWPAS